MAGRVRRVTNFTTNWFEARIPIHPVQIPLPSGVRPYRTSRSEIVRICRNSSSLLLALRILPLLNSMRFSHSRNEVTSVSYTDWKSSVSSSNDMSLNGCRGLGGLDSSERRDPVDDWVSSTSCIGDPEGERGQGGLRRLNLGGGNLKSGAGVVDSSTILR